MKLLPAIFALLLLLGCSKEAVQPTFCYECNYHEEQWLFCDMTEDKMDSVRGVFNHNGCYQDTLKCSKLISGD
jgi:hypothetical protein